ncbi:unnamed protein product [Phytomonas sp. Hart1]|nr:unnamed protein product [Phytomonas sp. Hart1]|eukprot:CCW72080.1 unnamed protein product [Phytomonas sp. isolate Hart1]
MARNKGHKQRFGSKHILAEKKKVRKLQSANRSVKGIAIPSSKDLSHQILKSFREKQVRTSIEHKRLGGANGTPRIIGVLPANESGNTEEVISELCKALGTKWNPGEGTRTIISHEKKNSFTFICEKNCNNSDCVDISKVSDILILVLDVSQMVHDTIKEIQASSTYDDDDAQTTASAWFSDVGLCITDYTRDLITVINSQSASGVVVALQNLHTFPEKRRQKIIKVHQRYFLSVLHESTKIMVVDDENSYKSLVHHLQVMKIHSLKWRDQHPYFAAENGAYDINSRQLTLCGYLRGQPLSATQLIHLTNHGTFQISNIFIFNENGEKIILDNSDETQRESLKPIQAISSLEDEGIPTEADIEYIQEMGDSHRIKVPLGSSDYQAVWYDSEENIVTEDGTSDIGISNKDNDGFVEAMPYHTTQSDVDFLKVDVATHFRQMSYEEKELEMQRLKEASEEDAWSPDIVDTPTNITARQRFAKYRGLKSFQTGKWDSAENLPPQYSYIYKLQGYSKIRANAIEKCKEGLAQVGQFVYITLESVDSNLWENKASCLLIASGQLEHEQKWSLLHFQVQRASRFSEPIKSKTPMLAHIGFRKFYVSPLFSHINSGDRTKFLRFFHEADRFCMVSFFGPISYNPCPILLFEMPSLEGQLEGSLLQLACFGGANPPNPDILILKRAILTGRVAVIHKRQIVVKYMFSNDDDVKWFRLVDLYTKLGRRGKILKGVGTHGLFKATFNDQVMQHDVVCMDLYKRVFPKWNTVAFNISEVSSPFRYGNEESES